MGGDRGVSRSQRARRGRQRDWDKPRPTDRRRPPQPLSRAVTCVLQVLSCSGAAKLVFFIFIITVGNGWPPHPSVLVGGVATGLAGQAGQVPGARADEEMDLMSLLGGKARAGHITG
eukprot:scaffold119873_cov36-Phaeocystis_antarctica.AAC.2